MHNSTCGVKGMAKCLQKRHVTHGLVTKYMGGRERSGLITGISIATVFMHALTTPINAQNYLLIKMSFFLCMDTHLFNDSSSLTSDLGYSMCAPVLKMHAQPQDVFHDQAVKSKK